MTVWDNTSLREYNIITTNIAIETTSFLNNFGCMHSLMSISLHASGSHGDGRGRTIGSIYLSSFRSLTAFDFMICMHAIIAGLLIPGWSNLI
jgi:hypothetical protein